MSWTKQQLIEQAFSEIGLAPYVFDASAEQYQDALRMMDSMIAKWDGRGIRLGYPMTLTPDESSLSLSSNVPDWANEAIYTNLAIKIAPSYGKMVSAFTQQAAKSSYQLLLSRFATPNQMQLPGTMPAGAGNKPWRLTNDPFLPDPITGIDVGTDSVLKFNG
jgi:hypothetical protein